MSFARPEQLWLLLILPVLVLWSIRGRMGRRRSWAALAQRGRAPGVGTLRRLGVVACLIVALAQPRWGRLASPQPPPGHDVILVVDVSRSMGAEDAVPNRLAVAVEAAESLVIALAQDQANRAGLVAFAGRGVLRYPLTENLGAVLDSLHRLRPGAVRPGGTDLGAALDAAIEALDPREHAEGRAIVVFSDGEDHLNRWKSRLDRLLEQDVMVHAVAVGDPDQGHPVPAGGDAKPLLYHGERVLSRRSDGAMESITRRTGGTIVPLGMASADLGTLYRTKIEPAARRHREMSRLTERAERFPLLLAAALAFLLAGCWPPGRGWSWNWGWRWRPSWRRPAKALGAASLLIAMAGAVAGDGRGPTPSPGPPVEAADPPLSEPQPSSASDLPSVDRPAAPPASASRPGTLEESAAEAIARGQAAYDDRRFDEALAAFDVAIARAPTRDVPFYDAAAALFQLGRHDEARRLYIEARQRADRSIQMKIDYALGNTALALGDIPSAIRSYEECIASKARGTALDAVRRDAEINLAFAHEQAQSIAVPQGQGSGDPSQSRRPDRRRNPDQRPGGGDDSSPEGQPDADSGAGGNNPEDDAGGGPRRNPPPKSRRRLGGAGGSRSNPPGARGDSPEDRLDAALENIRAAQSRRLPEESPPASANDDRKDW